MENKTTRILNLTPLTFRNGPTGTYLRPLEQGVDWPSGKIALVDETGGLGYIVELKEQDFIIDPDFLFRNQWYPVGPIPYTILEVQNNSSRFVNTYRLAQPNGKTEQMQSIPPGKNLQFNVHPPEVWSFRATFTDELVGIARIGFTLKGAYGSGTTPDPTLRLTLTDEFVEGWRKYQSRDSGEGLKPKHPDGQLGPTFTPRLIIGEKRASTPPQDAQEFLTATHVRSEFSKEAFNGRKNRAVREVEIAGVLLKWERSNHVLEDYHGEDKDDIQSLTIYADRMEVADHLRFPGTNVTIYARELAFVSDRASIDTTPLANPIRACSEFLTKDPEDPTNANFPADKTGNPTYAAKNGDKGEQGGTITLYVGEVFGAADDAGKKRFISRGGKGQEAEAGGLKKYVAQPGHLATYAKSQTFTVEDVMRLLELHTSERTRGARTANRADYWRWPGGETWPDKMGFPTAKDNPLRNGTAVAVKLLAYSDNPFYQAYLERGFLPGNQYDSWGGVGGKNPFGGSYEDKPNPAPRPCPGRDAYPGGWPGDGGEGGQILFHLEWGQVPKSVCDVGPGEPGEPTKEVKGGKPPGPVPAYDLTIQIVLKSAIESHDPTFTRTEVTGKDGQPAKARKIVAGTEAVSADCEVKQSQAKKGCSKPAGDRSWAHPNVVCAVLSYARTAYRNGFRDEAAAALDPYYALIGPNGSPNPTVGPDGKPKPIDERLRMALISVTAMRNNLIRNLDYYGKPPGWVPRLNALSNLNVLNAVRETAYETFYFADKLLRDYDALDDAREVSQKMSDALKAELDCAKKTLQEAYDKIPKSVQELMDVQSDLDPIKQDIKGLQSDALAMTEGTLKSQRIYSSAMQILGGIAKSLPVGQPFVGLAGSAFDAASQVDWNAEDPLKTARSAIDHFGNDVTKVMKDKKDQVSGLLTKQLRKDLSKTDSERKDAVTYLTGLLDDATKEPEDKAKRIEEHWKNFKVEERTELAEQIEDGKARIKEIDQLLPELSKEIVTLKRSANDAAEKLKLKNREEEKEQLEKDRTRTLQALNKLETHVVSLKAEKSQRLTAFADYRSKLVQTEEEALKLAEAIKPKNKEEAARRADARREKLDGLKEEITAAKEASSEQKELLEKRAETINEVMTNLEGLGDGLKLIGNGIVSLVTPLTPADPTWKRLAEQMLDTDPGLKNRAKQLEQKMCQALAKKTQKVEELFRWQQAASASIATITSTLGTLSELSRQRQSIDQGLNPAVKAYLEETKERAKDILAESIYWFVKSYQYEFLDDVADAFYNFNAWTDKLRELERTKATMAAAAGGSSASFGKAETVVLDKAKFTEVGDGVYKAETLRLGANLLRTRQTRGEKVKGDYKSCIIERPKPPDRIYHSKVLFDSKVVNEKQVWMTEMLDRLLKEGRTSFNFVTDFEKGSFELNDARVVDVRVTAFEIKTNDRNLTLTIRVMHSGQSVIAKRTADGDRVFFAFQSGKDDEPIFWQFQYNQSEPEAKRLSPAPSTNIVTENVKALFFDPKDQSAKPDFKDYSPGLFSDYRVEVTGPKDWRSKVQSIDKLAMNVTISEAP